MNFICATLLLLCRSPSDYLDYDYQKKFTQEITDCALNYNSSIYPYHRIPITLVQAQAIKESNWGRSRFATEGNNFFGMKENLNKINTTKCFDRYLKRKEITVVAKKLARAKKEISAN